MKKESTILFFGQITDHTYVDHEEMDIDQVTVEEFNKVLETKYPGLKHVFYQVSVNQAIKSSDYIIEKGSEIAILPQFSGG
jgi:molybdopterin converting factor small subunit